MSDLLKQYFNIAFLMGKPQELPASEVQLRTGIALALLTYMFALAVPFGFGTAVLLTFIDIGVTGATVWLALTLVGRTNRFEQAFGGWCGASMFINLAALPIYLNRPEASEQATSSLSVLPEFVLLVWSLSLLAHVIRHTFDIKMGHSIFIAFIYFVSLMTLISMIVPAPVAESSVSSQLIQPSGDGPELSPALLSSAEGVVIWGARVV